MVEFDDYGDSERCTDSSSMLRLTPQLEQLPTLMNVAELRHRVISQNLANVNTPGYTRLDVDFEKQLAAALQNSSKPDALRNVAPQIIEDNSASLRADGNNVDVDKEIGHLNKNALLFQMYSQLLRSQFESMRRAIEAPR